MSRLLRRISPLALGLALAACDAGSNAHTLTVWHAWGGSELATLKQLIAGYEKAHPGTEVIALQVPYDKLKDKYLRSAAANGGPDLLIGDADWSGKFAASDLVLPLEGFFEPTELKRFAPGALKSLALNGKHYALPESRETIALYYNKRLVPTPPASLEALRAGAAKVPGVETGMVLNAKFYYTMGYFFAAGGRLFDPDGAPAVAEPAGRAAFDTLAQLSRTPGILASPEYLKGDSLYKQGQTGMILNGPWALVDYQKALGPDLGVAKLPDLAPGRPARPWVGVKCMMFNPNADAGHRAMAKAFAQHMTSPEGQAALAEGAGHIPAVTDVQAPANSPLAVFAAQADVGTPVDIAPAVSLMWEPMDKVVRQVTEGESSPEDALTAAARVIAAKMEAQKAPAR